MSAAVPLNLLPEMMQAGAWRALAPMRVWGRRNWFYRRLLRGPLADHIVFHPHDACPRRLEDADTLLRGRFRFRGESVDVKRGRVGLRSAAAFARLGRKSCTVFPGWRRCRLAGGEAARKLATNLISQWIKRHARYSEPAWSPHVMARRLMHIFSHGRLVIANSDMLWRSRLFVTLREQARMLERIAAEAPDGLPRLEAAAALALSGACLDDSPATAGVGAGAAGNRNRASDPARWRPRRPFAGRSAARLSSISPW